MQRQHVEANRVSGLELPAENPESAPIGFDVRQIAEASFGKPARLGVAERARHTRAARTARRGRGCAIVWELGYEALIEHGAKRLPTWYG